jgi:hypothetical protein
VLVAEARPRKYHRRKAWIPDVDRNAGRDELCVAGRQRQRRADTRAQIEAGGPVSRKPAGGGGCARRGP